jgi:hypothetical protein
VDAAEALRRLGLPPVPAGQEGAGLIAALKLQPADLLFGDYRVQALVDGAKVPNLKFMPIYSLLLERAPSRN